MFKTKFAFILTVAILTFIAFWSQRSHKSDHHDSVHYHAGFKVYINNELQDFSKVVYMHSSPCVLNEDEKPEEDPQIEKAHLHDYIGDVVHVHREGGVWSDLFKNIKFPLPEGATVSGYINGSAIENILNYPIKSNDSLILTIGDSQKVDLNSYVSLDHIKEVEKKSESCGSN